MSKEKSLTKISSKKFSPAFTKGKSSSIKEVETEYIRNLQKQVHLLELESDFLRGKAKQATDIQPKLTKEAEKMMLKIKELQVDIDGMKLEITRKDATISMLKNEKFRANNEIAVLDGTLARERLNLTQQVVELKKMKEIADTDIARKDSEIVGLSQQHQQALQDARHQRHQNSLLQSQLSQKTSQHNQTSVLLDEKRQELLQKQSEMHLLEEKHNRGILAVQDKIVRDLKNEIESLRDELRQSEFKSSQHRIGKEKMTENLQRIANENISLQTQLLDLSRKIDHETLLKNERELQALNNSSQITRLRNQEEILSLESKKYQELLENERQKFIDLESKLMQAEEALSSNNLMNERSKGLFSQSEERILQLDEENATLRRDKILLTEHISKLQKQLTTKEKEVLQMEKHLQLLQSDVSALKTQVDFSKSTKNL